MTGPSHPGAAKRLATAARVALGGCALLATLWTTVIWVEAEKEVRILCSMVRPGKGAAEIDRMFATANLLTVERRGAGDRSGLQVWSRRNLALSRCAVTLDQGAVVATSYDERFRLAPAAAWFTLAALTWMAVRSALLAAGAFPGQREGSQGAPRSGAAWRPARALGAAALCLGAVGVAKAAHLVRVPLPAMVAEGMVGALALFFIVEAFAHLASTRPARWWGGAPVAILLVCSCVVLLLGG